jgi:hypothetical protein
MNRANVRLTADDQYMISVLVSDCHDLLNDYERKLVSELSRKKHVTGSQLNWLNNAFNQTRPLLDQISQASTDVEPTDCNRCGQPILWVKTHQDKNMAIEPTDLAKQHCAAGLKYIRDRHQPHADNCKNKGLS